ncbi:multidrug effflux MFS transporter [Furfurilactobacillus rossiae]|uniref:Bcr/CflA family efflux transporter n=1 Tax=Furfurilactobacillus rossiae DSM 15814 TaxID=1114972 RepID=A0A0R1RKS7_9LACO|nr:multidrug effflux MFS transporter [Furfurilactobacillus rossiae]KRL57415.1 major facilitator superfamily permease [Furfurilactobacillus rossiae DSM 15814]QFR65718.1 Bcr/CflA family efflux MFS transporter [Furfurilactobacillus rossiae]QLE61114.1 permease of the major facilitator [Furfurilactobacillus rossiae]
MPVEKQQTVKPSLFLTLLLGTLSAFGPLSLDMYLPALPQLQASFHTSSAAVQASISACLIGMAVGQLIIGPWSDRVGRRKPLLIGLIVFTLTSAALIFVHNIVVFLVLRVIQGLAGAAGQVLSRAVARDLFSGHRLTTFYATLMSINGIFPVIAPILGAVLVSFFPWESVFVTLTIVGILLVIASAFGLPETATSIGGPVEKLDFKSVFSNGRFMLNASLLALVYGALFTYIADSSFIFQQDYHLSTTAFSIIYAINGLGIALGSKIVGRVSEFLNEHQIAQVGFLVPLIGCAILVVNALTINQLWLFAVALWFVVSSVGFNSTITTAIAMESTTKNIGTASAILGTLSQLVGGVASPLVGLFGSHTAYPMIILISIFEALGLILLHFSHSTTSNKDL